MLDLLKKISNITPLFVIYVEIEFVPEKKGEE